jgi:phage-related minor tail protein
MFIMKACRLALIALLSITLLGCESAYYNAMESVGVHKRDILVDRIEDVQEAQVDAKEQFVSALERFKQEIDFDGGELEQSYNALNDEFEESRDNAKALTDRIDAVESVADALFDEWSDELEQYTNQRLRRQSESQHRATQSHYKKMLRAMRQSEAKMEPVLATLQDQVLFLKHNLNARAIASLESEFNGLKRDIAVLIKDMESSIQEANQFISTLKP